MTTKATVRVCTYNLLANSMAIPQLVQPDDLGHLALAHRAPLIVGRLEQEMAASSIICLQELDIKLAAAGIHQAFSENGYYSLVAHYSTMEGRDKYGNAIAFPTCKYCLLSYGEVRLGGELAVPPDHAEAAACTNPQVGNDLFAEAGKRDNVLLYAVLADRATRREFCVFTYHMPCAFWWPAVMLLHADALQRQVELLSGARPSVLCADLNSPRDHPAYRLLTSADEPELRITPSWRRSSRAIMQNAAPEQDTTWTRNGKRALFHAELDHILFLRAQGRPIPRAACAAVMPNAVEGSDHVCLAAEFDA